MATGWGTSRTGARKVVSDACPATRCAKSEWLAPMSEGLIPYALTATLLVNGQAVRQDKAWPEQLVPLVRLYLPDGSAEWYIAALDPENHDNAIGLASVGRGGGWRVEEFSLSALAQRTGMFGLPVARDMYFRGRESLQQMAFTTR